MRLSFNDSLKATVLISTYKRPECLRLQILAWIGCSAVAQIRVNWFQSVTPPGLAALLGHEFALQVPHGKVVFDKLPNKISHRFLPREFPTAAIFHSDDDVFYSCSLLESALTIWHGAGTSAVVGFNGRLIPTWGHSGARTRPICRKVRMRYGMLLYIGRGREAPSS